MKRLAILALLPWLWLSQVLAADSVAVKIDEWPVSWPNTRPRDPYVDGQNRVWFVGQEGDYIAYLDPQANIFKRFDLKPGTGPHNLIVDKESFIWYAGNRSAHIGKLNPENGAITELPMPDPKARDPHTLIFDHGGNIWFSVQGGNFVGKLTPASGDLQVLPVPTAHALPYGIVVDGQNRPWFAEFGTNQLGTVDPQTMTIREFTLPRPETRPRRLAATANGYIWYVDYVQGYLGRLDPATGTVQEWQAPSGPHARPYGMAADDRNRIWFVETGPQPNRLVGFDPANEAFFSVTEIPSGGGSVRHMYYHQPTQTLWFGTDADTVGRAWLP